MTLVCIDPSDTSATRTVPCTEDMLAAGHHQAPFAQAWLDPGDAWKGGGLALLTRLGQMGAPFVLAHLDKIVIGAAAVTVVASAYGVWRLAQGDGEQGHEKRGVPAQPLQPADKPKADAEAASTPPDESLSVCLGVDAVQRYRDALADINRERDVFVRATKQHELQEKWLAEARQACAGIPSAATLFDELEQQLQAVQQSSNGHLSQLDTYVPFSIRQQIDRLKASGLTFTLPQQRLNVNLWKGISYHEEMLRRALVQETELIAQSLGLPHSGAAGW